MRIVYLLSILFACLIKLECLTTRIDDFGDVLINIPCVNIVRRYFECQHLKMISSSRSEYYVPDTSIENNNLNDSFFETKLSNLSLEQSLDLQYTIYKSAYNCSSEFCRCVGLNDTNLESGYSSFFQNEDIFSQYKNAILDYTKTLETI